MIKLGYTILYVEDVTKTIEFYENSFGFERKFVTDENDYGELSTGETTLSFASISLGKQNLKNGFIESSPVEKPFGIELALITTDVQALVDQAIENGGSLVEEPIEKPWGQTVAYIRDLNGFLIEICTAIS